MRAEIRGKEKEKRFQHGGQNKKDGSRRGVGERARRKMKSVKGRGWR